MSFFSNSFIRHEDKRMRVPLKAAVLCLALALMSTGAWAQEQPLEGRWEGTLKTSQGQIPAKLTFEKQGAIYGGTISGVQPDSMLTFQDVKVDGNKITAKIEIPSQRGVSVITLRFDRKGDTLKGKGEFRMGQRSMDLQYELTRVGDLLAEAPAEPAKPVIGQARTQEELNAFNKLRDEVDLRAKKEQIDSFLQTYPDSGLAGFVHQEASYVAQQSNNFQMMADHAEKSLEIMPDNYSLMTVLANAYAERGKPDNAESNAERAIELILEAQKPAHVTEQQWADGKSMMLATNFSTLGYVHLRRAQGSQEDAARKSEAQKAVAPFKKALEYNGKDDISHWRLGLAYVFLNDYANAESHLARAVALNGVASANARSILEDIYKTKNQNLDGLDQVIAKAKSELGLP